jgi:16S rRNA processing protein RimM
MNLPALGPGDPAWPDDAVEVARVLGAWGVKGWIRIQAYASDPQALFSSKRWFLKPGEGLAPLGARPPALLRVIEAREHGDGVVAHVQDVSDRSAAEALRGARIFVGRSSFPSADPDEHYWVDLIGLAVVNREGQRLGTVVDLIDTGAHSVLRLQRDDAPAGAPADEAERLIPFVAAYVDDVNLVERRITVDWGLDY